ncbi:hypothetical protein NEMIN01_0010 [Nematocida minor]|uniref:uncharacterized protein n=1 Tax=Nematocida minor TaxID=1912983 RepID=UPI0022203949|nr:uncharacterized protein NEMIN01_0003 [Nematocida minor]XP_051331912.1 uncharacterized protein NEMIN01_0010 [Nematocida minor]KAI5188739.1 hypothetical protein NEMIN01_0003 [Nematocida minor]KAI5188746.1 hypothetical protein NEMIN01_0010 [Nematocida minor]
MQAAMHALKQPIENITDEKIEEIEEYIENEERVYQVASEIELTLFSYIKEKSCSFGNISKDI